MPAAPVHPALPLAAAALAAGLFIGMDTTAKLLSARFDALQITFLRFASGLLFALPLWLWQRSPMPPRPRWPLHGLRAVLLLVALVLWFHSLTLLPLVQAVAMGYTAPVFIALLAMAVLKERPSRWIWAALLLCGAGAAVALWPTLSAGADAGAGAGDDGAAARAASALGLAAAAASALAYSGVVVLARHQAQQDALWTILLLQNLLPVLLLAGPLMARGLPVAAADLGPVLLMGALATGGLLAITWAFTHIEASRAAPMEYTGLVWAGLLGFAVFGEVPSGWTLASAALIIGGCLLLMRR